jgi:N-carbamoylputrescine amidase
LLVSRKVSKLRPNKEPSWFVLQELHNSLYFCQAEETAVFDLAEPIPGASTEHFGKLAKALKLVIVTSLFERRAAGLYHNTAVVLDRDGSVAGKYRKMHIPDDPGYYEKFYFTPGDLGFEPIQTSVGKLGVLVCWDQWYPEAARLMAMRGAELLIYPTAIGWDPADDAQEQARQRDAWITIQRSHAIANGLPLIAVNRVGFEPGVSRDDRGSQFWLDRSSKVLKFISTPLLERSSRCAKGATSYK